MSFKTDIDRFSATSSSPEVVSQWYREHQSLKDAKKSTDVVEIATHLARATTADPAFNLFIDESRTVQSRNPLHHAFKNLHGTDNSLEHYQRELQNITNHYISFDPETHAFKQGDKLFKLDHFEF